jgi:hypothetical protein
MFFIVKNHWEPYFTDNLRTCTFQKSLFHVWEKLGNIKRKLLFWCGTATHYNIKNNFIHLCSHEIDFGTETEWHYLLPHRGRWWLGNSVNVSWAYLQKLQYNQVLVPLKFYLWIKENSKCTHIKRIHCSGVEGTSVNLQLQFDVVQLAPVPCNYYAFMLLLILLWL